jgi:hypothetical protein
MFGITDKIIGALALVLALALAWQTYRLHGAQIAMLEATNALANGQAAWADERANAATALAVATTKARETEQQLTAQAEKAEHEKQTQLAAVSARADALRVRLRNAEANAATARLLSGAGAIASTSEVEPGSNIAGFSGELGSRLVSEAERGEKIRISLLACYRQYEDARKAVSLLSP